MSVVPVTTQPVNVPVGEIVPIVASSSQVVQPTEAEHEETILELLEHQANGFW